MQRKMDKSLSPLILDLVRILQAENHGKSHLTLKIRILNLEELYLMESQM
jgi:hypothetical protein